MRSVKALAISFFNKVLPVKYENISCATGMATQYCCFSSGRERPQSKVKQMIILVYDHQELISANRVSYKTMKRFIAEIERNDTLKRHYYTFLLICKAVILHGNARLLIGPIAVDVLRQHDVLFHAPCRPDMSSPNWFLNKRSILYICTK